MNKKFIYVWKVPEPERTFYIVGEESFAGGRNDEYEKGCKISRNDSLGKNVKLLQLQPLDVSGISRDWDVHAILKDKPYSDIIGWDGPCGEGTLNTEEAFYIKDNSLTEDERDKTFCEIISTILTKDKNAYMRTDDWSLREYQVEKVKEAIEKLRRQNEVLMHVGMRGGKSVMSLDVARLFCLELVMKSQMEEDSCRILVITPFPSAIETFRGYTIHHKRMDGFNFYGNNEVPKKGDRRFVKLVSFQKDWDETLLNEIGDVDFIIVDETHHTSNSERSSQILQKISHKKTLHLSGTPLNDIFSGRFKDDQIVRLDFIDLMKISKEHPEAKIYPAKLNVYDVFNKEELKTRLYEYAKDNKAFMEWLNNNQTFDLDAIFKHEYACETFLKYISIDNRDFVDSPFYFDPKKHKHIIQYIPSVAGVSIAYKCLLQLAQNPESKFFGYKIFPVNKVEDMDDVDVLPANASDMENAINKFMDENDHTIILTCNRFTTGVTLARMDTIFNFRSPKSAEWFFQVMFRIMTYLEGKDEVSMFNFDSEYTIQIFKELAASRITPDKTEKEVLEDTFKCINYYKSLKGQPFEFGLVDVDEGYELFRKLPLSHAPSAVVKYPISELTQDERDALLTSDFTTVPNGKSLNIHEAPGGDQAPDLNKPDDKNGAGGKSNPPTSKKGTTLDKAKEKEEAKLLEKITCIGNNIAWTIVNNKIVRVDELLDEANIPQIVVNWNLTSVYNKLIGSMRGKWQQYIDDLNYRLRNKNYLEVVKNLPILNETDKTTPDYLRQNMLNKVKAKLDLVSISDIDSGWKFLDPFCGRGYIIFDVVEYLANRLGVENKTRIMDAMYGVDIEPHFVKMLNVLGYKNVKCADSTKMETWLKRNWEGDEQFKYNCIDGDSDMKFDLTIMNPPYSINRKSVHVKILKEMLTHRTDTGVCVCIAPSPYTNYKDESCFDLLPSSYEVVNISSAKKAFGDIQLADSLLITTWRRGVQIGKSELMKAFIPKEYKIVKDKIKTKRTFADVNVVDYTNEKFFVPLKLMTANWDKNKNIIVDKLGLISNGYVSGNIPYKDARTKNKNRPCGGIPFDDEQSARNFINSCMTTFFKFIVKMQHTNSRYILREYPWMEDYSQPWTNERFYDFFGITSEEQKMIEENMKAEMA